MMAFSFVPSYLDTLTLERGLIGITHTTQDLDRLTRLEDLIHNVATVLIRCPAPSPVLCPDHEEPLILNLIHP